MSERIRLGRIAGAHGVKGLIKIEALGEDPKLLEALSPLFTTPDGHETVDIQLKHKSGKFWMAAIQGLQNREEAQSLKGTYLYVERQRLPDIEDENVFYAHDLKGLTAIDSKGTEIGRIDDVQDFGAGDLLDVTLKTGENFYLPFRDPYVGDVDLKAGTVVIDRYEEMILE